MTVIGRLASDREMADFKENQHVCIGRFDTGSVAAH